MKQELVYPDLSYELTGIYFDVHNELGRFCNEKQYGDLLEKKLKEHGIRYEREKFLPQSFDGEEKNRNKIDFLVEGLIILELKAKRVAEKNDYYQVKRYLVAFNKKLGMLINFREKYLKPKRVLNSDYRE